MKSLKGIETRSLIRETAFKLFLTNDYGTVSLRDIERITKMTRGCTSYHYVSKQALFIDVIDQYVLSKQNIDNKMKNSQNLSLGEFIDDYIENIQYTMEHLSLFLLPDVKNNGTRAYMNLILQANRYYPDFTLETTLITQKELLLWERILKRAQDNEEINPQYNCRLIAKQFKYIFFGQSYNDALECGLNIQKLREQFMFIYQLIRV